MDQVPAHKWRRRFRQAVVFVVIMGAVLLAVKVIRRSFFPKAPVRTMATTLRPGTKLPLAVNWSNKDNTLVMVLDTKCGFCQASVPFYRTMLKRLSEKSRVQVVAVFPQSEKEATDYLNGVGLQIPLVRQATARSLRLQGTPSLILVNSSGLVTDLWVGQLRDTDEEAFFARLQI
jgi:hypothetical protein